VARILVVDDDPDFAEIIRTVLLASGYEVSSAASGSQALQMMRQEVPDLVLLDVMMSSVLDGVNVSHTMNEDAVLKHVPIIMLSSIANSPAAGMFPTDEYLPIDAWLSKPIRPAELLKTVAQFIRVRDKSESVHE
jgi:CheY-like chemotaxis protein